MWYFTWMLGVGFAIFLSILNALWGEFEQDREIKHEDTPRDES